MGLIQAKNGNWPSGNLHNGLTTRLKRIHSRRKKIHRVRLFTNAGYFVWDSEGKEWAGLNVHLSNKLTSAQNAVDVVVAGDGPWRIICQNHFISSQGISSKLTTALSQFYVNYRKRQSSQQAKLAAYDRQQAACRGERGC